MYIQRVCVYVIFGLIVRYFECTRVSVPFNRSKSAYTARTGQITIDSSSEFFLPQRVAEIGKHIVLSKFPGAYVPQTGRGRVISSE